ncbi:MAG: hypothetical protein RR554_01285 [Vagococcus sp.]|uniref:hypothetical protein n=1 Tax=Vagococcus sp. TaxID=1933889 RepID=UPI002FCAAFD5
MKNQRLITIWGDAVGLFDLIQSLLISACLTLGGFFMADSQNPTQQLFFGLLGAVLGFIINSFLVKPKRNISTENTQSEDQHG